MQAKNIALVMKDDGGINNVLPICREYIQRGRNVKIFTNGRANDRLKDSGLEFTPVETTEEFLLNCPNPDLLVTSMCSDGGVGRDLVPILRGSCPVVATQDYWGVRLVTEWSDPKFRPDYITVNDQLGADLVLKAWPEFKAENICQIGFPMFDSFGSINSQKEKDARCEVRTKLQVHDRLPIIFFPCGVLIGASEMLDEVLSAVRYLIERDPVLERNLKFIPRVHPRLEKIAPQEFKPWNNLLNRFNERFPGIVVFDESIIRADIKILILASDVVVSDYSTTLLEAVLIGSKVNGKANISIMYPRPCQVEFRNEFGTLFDEPPFVTMECTAKAINQDHLRQLLANSIVRDKLRLILKNYQVRCFPIDGRNTERNVDFFETLIR